MKGRNFPSFIAAYESFLSNKSTPREYATWAAVWAISAAVERRVWTFTMEEELYPNLFVMLAGPPATGKGNAIQPVRALVNGLGPNRVSASSMTSASLVDDLRASDRSIVIPGQQTVDYHCLNICSPEFQVLFPAYDTVILAKVTDIYDCKPYGETRRGGKGDNSFYLERPCMTMLGGTTPEHFFGTFPEAAFRTGFFSRMIIVWGNERHITKLISKREAGASKKVRQEMAALQEDLTIISKYTGEFTFDEESEELVEAFYRQNHPYGGDPVPSHPRLLYYCARRHAHLCKLMMIFALDRGVSDELILTADDYHRAYNLLIATEARMPELFADQNQGGHAQLVSDVHHELWLLYVKHKKPLPKAVLTRLLGARAKAFEHDTIIKMMVSGGWVRTEKDKKLGTCYVPLSDVPTDAERKMK